MLASVASYDVVEAALRDPVSAHEGAGRFLVADLSRLLEWIGPHPWVWSACYGNDSSARVITPHDEAHLARVLLNTNTPLEPKTPGLDLTTPRRVRLIAATQSRASRALYESLRVQHDAIIIVLSQSIDTDVLRIAQQCLKAVTAAGHKKIIIAINGLLPGKAEELLLRVTNLVGWVQDEASDAQIGVAIAHTPSAGIDALQPFLAEHGFQASITIPEPTV